MFVRLFGPVAPGSIVRWKILWFNRWRFGAAAVLSAIFPGACLEIALPAVAIAFGYRLGDRKGRIILPGFTQFLRPIGGRLLCNLSNRSGSLRSMSRWISIPSEKVRQSPTGRMADLRYPTSFGRSRSFAKKCELSEEIYAALFRRCATDPGFKRWPVGSITPVLVS